MDTRGDIQGGWGVTGKLYMDYPKRVTVNQCTVSHFQTCSPWSKEKLISGVNNIVMSWSGRRELG